MELGRGRQPPERSAYGGDRKVDQTSSQTAAETIVEGTGTDFEGSFGIIEPLAQALDQRSQPPTISTRGDRRIREARPKPSEVDQDLGLPREEASEQALSHGMARHFRSCPAKGLEQAQPLEQGLEEKRQDGRAVLTSGKTEVGQERHRPALRGTQKTANPDPSNFSFRDPGLAPLVEGLCQGLDDPERAFEVRARAFHDRFGRSLA